MDNNASPPIAIFGFPLKRLLSLLFFFLVLLLSFDFLSWRQPLQEQLAKVIPGISKQRAESSKDIVATPETVEAVKKELIKSKAEELESKIINQPEANDTYILELRSGSSLRAQTVTITPETVIFVSQGGVQTEIAREAVIRVRRITQEQSIN
jgi:hypothetical protein